MRPFNDGGPAFPHFRPDLFDAKTNQRINQSQPGMAVIDLFAVVIAHAFVSTASPKEPLDPRWVSAVSYELAGQLVGERYRLSHPPERS